MLRDVTSIVMMSYFEVENTKGCYLNGDHAIL